MERAQSTWTRSRLSTSRLEALVDGVFGVAMTLLVLTITVPREPAGLSPAAQAQHLLRDLVNLRFALLTYAISFVVAGIYWVGHHNQYAFIRRTDRVLLWINIPFLMGVTCIPFSTALLGAYPSQQIAVALYGGNLTVIGLVLYLHWWYATTGQRLTDRDLDPLLVRRAARRILVGPTAYVLAIGLSFASTAVSLAIYVLVPVLYILPGRLDRHWSAAPSATSGQHAPPPREEGDPVRS
jgi:uncharacterized membrane protein